MIPVLLGGFSFPLFIAYDLLGLYRIKGRFVLFFIGGVLLGGATLVLIFQSNLFRMTPLPPALFGTVSILNILFLILLFYTLFFAIPFRGTYLSTTQPQAITTGMYALCRHPGVLWLSGFYGCLALLLYTPSGLLAFLLYTVLDVLYVLFQDRWLFPKSLKDYETYQKNTPFLIPNKSSIRQAFRRR